MKVLLRYFKHAEPTQNRIGIPKVCIEKFGRDYYLEVYDNFIKLVPIKKGE